MQWPQFLKVVAVWRDKDGLEFAKRSDDRWVTTKASGERVLTPRQTAPQEHVEKWLTDAGFVRVS